MIVTFSLWNSLEFPFIRFTNWKQAVSQMAAAGNPEADVSIHTLHELEARFSLTAAIEAGAAFPFIRFTNWKQDAGILWVRAMVMMPYVSIHTLHELEASYVLKLRPKQ